MPSRTIASSRRSNSRDDILVAAEAVLAKHGGTALTIDAVAHEAGRSKGGVLHHFPSKGSLIDALIDRSIGEIEAFLEKFERDGSIRTGLIDAARLHLGMLPTAQHVICLVAMGDVQLHEAYRGRLTQIIDRRIAAGGDDAVIYEALILLFGIMGTQLLGVSLPGSAESCVCS